MQAAGLRCVKRALLLGRAATAPRLDEIIAFHKEIGAGVYHLLLTGAIGTLRQAGAAEAGRSR